MAEFDSRINQASVDRAAGILRQVPPGVIDAWARKLELFFYILGIIVTWGFSLAFDTSIAFYRVAPWYVELIFSLAVSRVVYRQFNRSMRTALGDPTAALTTSHLDAIMRTAGFSRTGSIPPAAARRLDTFLAEVGPTFGAAVNRVAVAMVGLRAALVAAMMQIFLAALVSYYFIL